MARSARTVIGISGWTYAGWRGRFYPEGLPHRRELEHASRTFRSIEINGSFYSLARPDSWRRWHDETPEDFVFAVKGSRFITHMKKLKEPRAPLANFFAQGVLRLGRKLGPILWQFPESFRYDAARVAAFLDLLPRDHAAAAALARHHDHRLEGRAWLDAQHAGPVRHAMEVRHESWMCADFIDRLRAHGVALVFADTAGKWPYAEDVTADFVYVRLHGAEELYASGYRDEELDWWAALHSWTAGREPRGAVRVGGRSPKRGKRRDAYVYFDNDAKVQAPFDAQRLAERLRTRK
jgi:uncharacterized protein YecE (DUF72 family)